MEEEFACSELSDPVRYENMTRVRLVPGTACFEIDFKTPKGKKRQVSIKLEGAGQEKALQELLARRMPGAAAVTRSQTAKEAGGGWVTAGLTLAGLVVLIILLNTVGHGTSVRVPVMLIPFIMLGSFLGTGTMIVIAVAILVIFGTLALLALKKRKTVWEIRGRE